MPYVKLLDDQRKKYGSILNQNRWSMGLNALIESRNIMSKETLDHEVKIKISCKITTLKSYLKFSECLTKTNMQRIFIFATKT